MNWESAPCAKPFLTDYYQRITLARWQAMRDLLPKGGTYIDYGAGIGDFAQLAKSQGFADAVIAVEGRVVLCVALRLRLNVGFQIGFRSGIGDVVNQDLDHSDFKPIMADGVSCVFLLGILYHLREPLDVLRRIVEVHCDVPIFADAILRDREKVYDEDPSDPTQGLAREVGGIDEKAFLEHGFEKLNVDHPEYLDGSRGMYVRRPK